MSQFEKRVQLNKIIESQLPEFLVADFPKAIEFFKQYYISQEHQGGNVDLVDNLDRYLKIDNLVPEVVVGQTTLSSDITASSTTITVSSTKGFPDEYGLLKIGDEVITYTGKTTTTFTGCVRGFSGITGYDDRTREYFISVNRQNVIFSDTTAAAHTAQSSVQNLSALFLQEFYRKLKKTFTPGFEGETFVSDLDVGNFIKHARNFYQSKGIEESIRILFKVLYGVSAKVIDLETRLIKPSSAEFVRREIIVAEPISGNPLGLEGQTVFRSVDTDTSGSVSDVEIFTRNNRTFYKLGLFVGYNDRDLVEGTFGVPGFSRSLEEVSIGSSVISVDSTIGFGQTGELNVSGNVITYQNKSINQFFDCVGVTSAISLGEGVRANEVIFGYENGDTSKRVELRVTGVLSDFEALEDIPLMEVGEEIFVRNIGEIIENPIGEKTFKESFANSWLYNTSTRLAVDSIQGSTFILSTDVIDKSFLKVGDSVDIVVGSSNVVSHPNAIVDNINFANREVTLTNLGAFVPLAGVSYSIRRNIVKVTSATSNLKLGNDKYIANTLNVYTDDKNEYGYVASHSLPGYQIVDEIVESKLSDGSVNNLEEYDSAKLTYKTIKFPSAVRFIDGDEIVYTATNPLKGLESGGFYYVKLVDTNKIRVYSSKSRIKGDEYVELLPADNTSGEHIFTLKRHENRFISQNNIFRKFPIKQSLSSVKESDRNIGNVGILIDGVEISSPQSRDKIYWGPLEKFDVLNGGSGYDVINPPNIRIGIGSGTQAYVEPVVIGSVKDVIVDPQNFDIDNVLSISLSGGNGSGCVLQPVVGDRFRELLFDSRPISLGGGVDIVDETITFREPHNLFTGQSLIYNQNGNNPINIGNAYDTNNITTGTLGSGDEYAISVVNSSTIKLHKSRAEALAGINTIGFSTATAAAGIHKFRTLSKKNLRQVKVLESGSGYAHRKLRVKTAGVSTAYNTIEFPNHGFKTGETVTYSKETFAGLTTTTSEISIVGLHTENQYSIYKVDDNRFKLINVGVSGTVTTDLVRNKFVDFVGFGTIDGYHVFKYPEIKVVANVSFGATTGEFVFTPIVTGEVSDAYLYETGSGYGSTTLNLHRKPIITIETGSNSQLAPIILNGRIADVQVLNKGNGYAGPPELVIEDTSTPGGTGAILRPVMDGDRLSDIIVINSGIGYSANSTSIFVKERGFGAKFDTRVRDLSVNDAERFADFSKSKNTKIFSNLYKNEKEDSLVYGIYGYSEDLAENYEELGGSHSPIIGWAYDGNPIYGPFGYSSPSDVQSGVKILDTSYELKSASVEDRPPNFKPGFFIEDYRYTGSGDLDRHNGRFCITPDYPNGIYAYFVGVTTSATSPDFEPKYPYFVGNTYKSNIISENFTLDHTFDFNNSNLVRNTFPYNINKKYADYDFINEGYEVFNQASVVKSVTQGEVDDVKVIEGGLNYVIGDRVNFDIEGANGAGLRAEVSELVGAGITALNTILDSYESCVFEWDNENQVSAYFRDGFDLLNNDRVVVGGLSTSITSLVGTFNIGFTTSIVSLAGTMINYSSTPYGIAEDIFVSRSVNVSTGTTVVIHSEQGSETAIVLNNFGNGVLKIKRPEPAGVAHTLGSRLEIKENRLTLPVKTQKFTSSFNDIVYFNAKNAVGVGTTSGSAVTKSFNVGITTVTVSIPTRQIYLPKHPFKTGQKVTYTNPPKPGTAQIVVGASSTVGGTFNLLDGTDLYVINKGENYIGLVTTVGLTTSGNGLYFHSDGDDHNEYKLVSNKVQVTGDVSRIVTTVSCGTTHGLENGDTIKLVVKPNTIVGLGTTAALRVEFNQEERKLLINPVGINSSNINIADNTITITDHGYRTGDKVYYESVEPAAGLHTGSYYVIKESSDKFKVAETLYDAIPTTQNAVNIVGTGDTNHRFSLINPEIDVVKNSDLQFDLSHESLDGFKLKIFREGNFINEYTSSYDENGFNVIGVGTVGVGTTGIANLTIEYSENIPDRLFYALEKSGYISTADTDVQNYSQINYINSPYTGTYDVFGVGSTTFNISPVQLPTVLNYVDTQCDELKYTTKSRTALSGSIANVNILSKGFNFESLPKFSDVTSEEGTNANIAAISTSIGRIRKVRFKDFGYDYPSDKTLRPEAIVPPVISIDNLDTITDVSIQFGGARYLSDPDLILWNDTKKQIVDSTTFIAHAPNGAIAEVEQLAPIFGLESEPHKIIAINNSNGVGISSMTSGDSGIATCILNTPILGFTSKLFEPGDRIFVEGVELIPGTGEGFNSADYEYKFFEVTEYNDTSPAVLKFRLVGEDGIGLSTNPGIAKTFQSGYATIINKSNYPIIDVKQERAKFTINEKLFVDTGTGFFDTDLEVSLVRDDYIKIRGDYNLRKSAKIKGIISGAVAEVTNVDRKRAKFNISYSSKVDLGWSNDIGKINEDYQVTPNNDYYQNLSYSIKSPITWDESSGPVNSIIHPAGLKNFVDVGITSVATSRAGLGGTTSAIVILDVVNETRVDTINNFDNALDDSPRQSPVGNFLQSNSLQIENRKLTDFTECRTNRVLIHDDISPQFSSKGFQDIFVELEEIEFSENHNRYLVQVVDPDTSDIQLSELVLQSTATDTFLFEKYSNYSNKQLGSFRADTDGFGRKTIIFDPVDPYETDHDIKILKKSYLYQALPGGVSGVGTQSLGSVDVIGTFTAGIGSVGTASSIKTIAEFDATEFNGAFANIEISDRFGTVVNYVEAAIDFDGSDTYLSEYYFDATTQSYSYVQTGILSATYDSNAGTVSLTARNSGISSTVLYDVRSNIVGFGTTTAGIGTYRFLLNNQPAGTELSARLESTVGFGTTVVRIGSYDINSISAVNSIVRVSAGQSSAIHQVNILANDQDSELFVTQGPFSPTNNTTGIGTFGGEIIGSNFHLNFYPDSGYDVETQAFGEVLYRGMDFDNQANPLEYGPASQLVLLSAFDGLNGLRANRVNFTLKHEGDPIYTKIFDPSNTSIIDYATGIFSYPNHFFNTGEELIYTPEATFVGVGKSAMGIGSTENYLGIVTDRLPERVYPIALTPDTFQLATKPEWAREAASSAGVSGNVGIAITFTDAGLGNSHELEFTKKLTKTVVALDGIVQQPIAFTPINHLLENNNGGITAGISTFNLSGISSVQPRDLLRIDDEYMKVVEVGLSTNVNGQLLGPINGIIAAGAAATYPTVSVVRGIVGSAATTHTDGAEVRIYRGAINIVKNEIFFVDPPKGNSRARRNSSNLPYVKAEYTGRTFLRSNYDTNMLFDDISDSFTGIAKTYTTTIEGINTSGVQPGNGILFINGVFQTPSTLNNAGNNYVFERDTSAGISSVVFTGITSTNGLPIQSEFDINQNQIPRGGLVVSLGSTPGLGYAPLVGAVVKAEKDSSGTITDIVGINTWTRPVSISTATYNKISGILEVETVEPHNLRNGDSVKLVGLAFTCPSGSGITTTIFPDHDRALALFNVVDANKVNVLVGPSTITHYYTGDGEIYRHYNLNFGSGYRSPVSIAVTDRAYEHRFVRAGINSTFDGSGNTYSITNAKFTSHTGELQVTIDGHGLTTADTVGFDTGSIVFRCSDDDFFTEQVYPRPTDPAAGVNLSIASTTVNTLTVNVGPAGGGGTGAVVEAVVGAGGTLALNIVNGGTGYINPIIEIPEPNYENMPVTGVSRLGVGATTETGKNLLLNLTVGAAGTSNVGIGSTLFSIESFKIARNGYGFQPGDVVKVVGLVTAKDYTAPIADFQVEITQTFNDFFSSWSFGEMDYIDSIAGYQDGNRKRFPLFYNGELLAFEIDPAARLSSAIDLDAVLVIFVNGVLQTPGYAYQFLGGTSFTFTEAPKVNDRVDIFFYVGQNGIDVGITTVRETIKVGDDVFVRRHPGLPLTVDQIEQRTISEILGSDTVETAIYTGPGVNQNDFKPFYWTKQKKDKFVKGDVIYKTRASLEPRIFPTAKVIGDVNTNSDQIFVDNAQFFDYDEVIYDLNINTFEFDAFMVDSFEPVSAAFTATVSAAGTVTSIQILDGGSGYTGSTVDLKFSAPRVIGVGVGTTATGTATVGTGGSITSVTLTNPGMGYTNATNQAIVPQIITEVPTAIRETIGGISNVQGFTGIITGIGETTNGSGQKAIKFFFSALKDYTPSGESELASDALDLQVGYPIIVSNTKVGHGVTSVYDSDNAVVSIGTTFLDNIYIVDSIFSVGPIGVLTCNVHNATNLTGIGSTGNFDEYNAGLTTSLGTFSWGRIYNFNQRTNPISIGVTGLTIDSGLSTFPTIQRRGNFGESKTGAVRSRKPIADPNIVQDNILPFYP